MSSFELLAPSPTAHYTIIEGGKAKIKKPQSVARGRSDQILGNRFARILAILNQAIYPLTSSAMVLRNTSAAQDDVALLNGRS
jgi:hypothetical protein